MSIDPNNLPRTAIPTFAEAFSTLDLWDGASGLDTSGGPQGGSYVTGTGTRPFNQGPQWYVRADPQGDTGGVGLPNPFSVQDGILTITASPTEPGVLPHVGDQPYTSGLISTHHAFSQTYGYFEMRAELPAGQGLWPAFWMLSADGGSWPPEIDVMEVLGHDPTTLYTTVHSLAPGQTPGNHTMSQGVAEVADMTAGYHTYGVDWQPDTITWTFDGQPIFEAPTPDGLDGPMYLIANLAVGGTWPGSPDATTAFPARMNIDSIRAYRSPPDDDAGLEPVYHLYNAETGHHVYTASAAERAAAPQAMPGFVYHWVGWAAPEDGPDTLDVFRFVNPTTGGRFYTASTAERDGLIAGGNGYRYEGVAFDAYADPEAAGAGAVSIERFANPGTGQHDYATSQAEIDDIDAGHAGAGWIDEGYAFTLHVPTADMHGL